MHACADNPYVDGGFDALDYGYAPAPTALRHPAVFGERDLWCAVIAQAFVDIGVIVPLSSGRRSDVPTTTGRKFDEALRWLLRDRSDFERVCDLAGVSPQIIRRAALMFYSQLLAHTQK